ncbi:MAG: hypothetical protein QW424_04935 [Candidatus Bathyarchaeia archaeon]
MVKRSTLLKLSILIVELSSIPLVVLASIYLFSGYQMLAPEVKIIPEPRRIHVDRLLRILTVSLAYLHALAGIIIMAERRIKKEILRKIVEISAAVILTILLLSSLIIEIMVLDISHRYQWGRRT